MLRTMNENVAIANSMFVVNESALRALVTSGKFYDLSDKETLYSVSNRRQIVAAMFEAQYKGNLTFAENARLQQISKGYAVKAVMEAAERILSETAQIAETVVDEVAELKAQLAAMQASETAKSLEIRDLKVELGEAKRDASIKTEIINSLKAKNLVELVSRTKVVDKVVTKVQELVSVKL